jgi:hypothetical protein
MSEVSRRAVLGAGAGVLGLLFIGAETGSGPAPTSTPAAKVAAEPKAKVPLPTRSHYASSVGKAFTATAGEHTYKLKLAHIRNVSNTSAADSDECFNLIFTAAGKTQPPEAIYTLRRKGVVTQSLFVSRLGTDQSMQALVSRAM